jgi:hypothetical protein
MKKQIIKIALYDGWVKYRDSIDLNTLKKFYLYQKKDRIGRIDALVDLYATNLNELHRVALDVLDELRGFEPHYFDIQHAVFNRPIRGKYTHLIKAVADGIDYLNSKNI